MADAVMAGTAPRGMSREEKKVIFASSLGTVFEWYDFYLYGSLAAFIGAAFFSQYPEATRNIFALLAFAAGFLVRPFGALVFGRLGDLVGRKYTFLITLVTMGLSTALIGLLPTYATLGMVAPILLVLPAGYAMWRRGQVRRAMVAQPPAGVAPESSNPPAPTEQRSEAL